MGDAVAAEEDEDRADGGLDVDGGGGRGGHAAATEGGGGRGGASVACSDVERARASTTMRGRLLPERCMMCGCGGTAGAAGDEAAV
jgi:hypothetical protein